MVKCLETPYNRRENHTKIKGASGEKESREVRSRNLIQTEFVEEESITEPFWERGIIKEAERRLSPQWKTTGRC